MRAFSPSSLIVALALVAPAPARGMPQAAVGETAVESSAAAGGHAAFVGRWTLDEDQSEDLRQKMQEAMKKGRRGGGGPGGRGGGGMPAGGRGGGRPPLLAFFSAKDITIANVEPAVAIVEPDGLVRTLQPDGEPYDVEHGEGRVETRWKDDALEVETTSDRGRMKETWTVAPDTGQLTVLVELESRGLTVRRVCDRAQTPE